MDFSGLLDLLGPFKEQVIHFYSIGSLVISLLVVLWVFNLVASSIHRTYLLGKSFGNLYRKYIHRFLKFSFKQLISAFNLKSKESNTLQKI